MKFVAYAMEDTMAMHFLSILLHPKAEVTKVEYIIVYPDNIIPVGYHRFIHFFNALEGTVTEPQNIGVIEVSVGGEKHLIAIEFVV